MNQLDLVPKIKGISKQSLLQLYVAKCQDLKINASKQQMIRFFDIMVKNHQSTNIRKLNLSDAGLGDACLQVVAKILKNGESFAHVDLSKNFFTNQGLRVIGETLKKHNTSVIHLKLGGNHISADGASYLFQCLENHPSIVSLDLANNDCYKNKLKIGVKGALAL